MKYDAGTLCVHSLYVAPFAGARIEIEYKIKKVIEQGRPLRGGAN